MKSLPPYSVEHPSCLSGFHIVHDGKTFENYLLTNWHGCESSGQLREPDSSGHAQEIVCLRGLTIGCERALDMVF
jgi:hypothetical protein